MTAKATATKKILPVTESSGESELRHYSPEQVHDLQLLPFSPRTLREKAYAGEFPHSKASGRISFRLKHIREIADMYDVRPISEMKPFKTAA
ncbi:hypothetical protein [Streptomyces syringium]|uniref:hypothetical protein n=1 Tax=Streptomyces syringium TaxID=76729 RepID=UPI0037D2850F